MNFWEHQDKARRGTKVLVFYYALTVILLIAAIYCIVAAVSPIAESSISDSGEVQRNRSFWNLELFLWVAGGTIAVVTMGSLFKIVELSGGGSKVAEMLGGRPLNPVTQDPDERKLMNVIEEMSIASGVPMPEVYVLEDEKSINAFAAGTTLDNAAIGVTRGCMKLLSRDELQGVMAHEFSHILNGDMKMNIRLIGVLNGILCLAIIGRVLLHVRGGRDRNNVAPIIGIALLILGSIGLLFGRLIKSAISRQREFLADASAVQFTRNPDSIAGALKKIGGLSYGSRLENSHAEEASHMFFGNGIKSWAGAFATHPPLVERIKAIDPGFDGKFPKISFFDSPPAIDKPGQRPRRHAFPFPEVVSGIAASQPIRVRPQQIVDQVAAPTRVHLDYASDVLESLSGIVRNAAHETFSACALVYVLLLSPDKSMQTEQLQLLKTECQLPVFSEVLKLLPEVMKLDTRFRLPLVDLSLPALRQLSKTQFEDFSGVVRKIIESDRSIDLFEYALERILRRHLKPTYVKVKPERIEFHSINGVLSDCAVVLSGLAHLGSKDTEKVRSAYQKGAATLGQNRPELQMRDFSKAGLAEIDRSLDRMALAAPPIKRRILNAMANTVAADNEVLPREAELLRAIADTLNCPIPPFVELL